MGFLDQRIKDISKVLIGIPVSSIDTTVLVVKLDGTGNSLRQSEARGLGLDVLQFVPFGLGNMFSNKRVLRLNIGEFSRSRRVRQSWRSLNIAYMSKTFPIFLIKPWFKVTFKPRNIFAYELLF